MVHKSLENKRSCLTECTESNEPAFLRKLRSQHGGSDSARHERPLARPRKQVKDGEGDDTPTYVVENSQDTLSKAEYDALIKAQYSEEKGGEGSFSSPKADSKKFDNPDESEESAVDAVLAKQHVAAIGASNKRRLAKVVGDEEERAKGVVKDKSQEGGRKVKSKKGKRVKLSFSEEAA